MPKFLKGVKVNKVFSEAIEDVKLSTKLKALAGSKMTIKAIYQTMFFAIDGFLTGKPERAHKLAWRFWVIPGIDKKFNADSVVKAKQVLKETKGLVSSENMQWIKSELRPYFEQSLQKQLKISEDMLEKIDLLKVKENIKVYKQEVKGHYK